MRFSDFDLTRVLPDYTIQYLVCNRFIDRKGINNSTKDFPVLLNLALGLINQLLFSLILTLVGFINNFSTNKQLILLFSSSIIDVHILHGISVLLSIRFYY